MRKLTEEEKKERLQKILDTPELPGFKRLIWDEDFQGILRIEEVEPDRGLDLPAKE